MTRTTIVIGANYGDEGKGLVTDALAGPDSLVVRFNGGAQAGHTVTAPDGARHVFSHFGSGTLRGAATFLSRFFVAHPLLFGRELAALRQLGAAPRVTIDPDAPVTTPFDMLVNQWLEEARGAARHGSCGIGFGETLERTAHLPLLVRDLADRASLRRRLDRIRRDWVPRRLAALGLGLDDARAGLVASGALEADFLDAADRFLEAVHVAGTGLLRGAADLIFEGAQGLALDQDRGAFPHVTRSHTGLRNALALAEEAGRGAAEAVYVTRLYLTRHGAGPLPGGTVMPPGPGVVDATNRPNPWQGSLRFAPLDLCAMAGRVAADLGDAAGHAVRVMPAVAVTCLDQLPEGIEVRGRRLGPPDAAAAIGNALGAARLMSSWGPTRATLTSQPQRRAA